MAKKINLVLEMLEDTAYVEFKDFSDLQNQVTLDFGKQNVVFYLWRSLAGLYRNTNFKVTNYYGAYVAFPGRFKTRGVFGEIHLITEFIGAGMVAHEIQHFIFDWLLEQDWSRGEISERAAHLCGEITTAFWRWYWESVDESLAG